MGRHDGSRPCVFVYAKRSPAVSVHGDDFATTGPKFELDCFENQLEAKYKLKKGGRVGPAPDDAKEFTILSRIIRWTERGIEYEADPRQGERLLEGLGLDERCKSTATPGLKPLIEQLKEDKLLCGVDGHTALRLLAARAN